MSGVFVLRGVDIGNTRQPVAANRAHGLRGPWSMRLRGPRGVTVPPVTQRGPQGTAGTSVSPLAPTARKPRWRTIGKA